MTNSKTDSGKRLIFLKDETESTRFAEAVAFQVEQLKLDKTGLMVYLKGDLGAGKSFFSRAFVQHFIPAQKVKSPTYTLVESYKACNFAIHHLDLYRLCDPEELEYLAIRDLLSGSYVALVEWPQKALGLLPAADIELNFCYEQLGRQVELTAFSDAGRRLLEGLLEF
ncbi:MAG: tRNA (adenosine(37)-N6)-threonylcarbamoyltransferase complex ATPase subunit type 1 TsaE [Thiomicrorhabdus chilensis]|uniref:tRNA (adenosine(37)-N6)-threonylcarbamoyltransferase complex ATPase subunit type 1 TsaE n=1 Tax=Thiomicrorhabdus chilensis TaxID=63656 RepID=UPI00299F300D|nr:tRNA (adenosine(37)-N6)-threonylcarbamoyltransferase complex ATPase subunit type 1 TsaE [Thiomicrorhabdus chilensis]MDX1347033.1 tRNA (adenosine(37)-N6)-threonylcarbamoyltransferase complex ATPase subunit type 1 TsaE [Thiomicrorhabdus chilensis]